MCGIVGIFSIHKSVTSETVKKMNASIIRRGPDGEGYYHEENLSMGMRRLAIIDLDHGWQPIYNETGDIIVVFNGEIFNHKELRIQLQEQGHIFKTHSDTEVLVHLYEQYGTQMMTKLRGMFAFCIWDKKNKKGLICRDRFGIKPLFIAKTDDFSLVFSSEIKAMIVSGLIKKVINPQAVDAYISYNYIPAPLTIYQGIFKLEPSHYLEFSMEGVSTPKKYWDPNDIDISSEASKKEIERELIKSVELHMESDVPVGSFLSGGIDSSLVTVLASKSQNFYGAFTAGFKASNHLYDERPIAELVTTANDINVHHKIEIDPDPQYILKNSALAFDEPFADDSIFPTWEICKKAAQSVKVSLTGLGGDELFGGYYRYHGIKLHHIYSHLPLFLRELIFKLAKGLIKNGQRRIANHALRFLEAGTLSSKDAYISYLTAIQPKERLALFNQTTSSQISTNETEQLIGQHFDNCTQKSAVKKAIYADIRSYVPEDILALSDRVSMWHSLELRVPLMDHALFERCFTMSEKNLMSFFRKKITLREISQKYLPDELFRKKKQGFESPMAEWINNDLKEFVDSKLSKESIQKSNIFNHEKISELLQTHRSLRRDNSKIIFSILAFQVWHQESFSV